MPTVSLLLALACAGPADDVRAGDTAADTPAGDPPDPYALAAEVSEAELEASIRDLVAFGTRHTDTDGDDRARDWLVERLEGLGLVAEVDAFDFRTGTSANVIARKDGVATPEAVWIFSAHYDSTSEDPDVSAPGADDNASAVAAVLEAARILGPHTFRESVWFVLTGAEEQGARGARHLVERLEGEGVEVRGVVAPDMIGYWPLGDGDAFDILGDEGSEALAADMAEVADTLGVANKVWIQHDYCYGDDHTWYQDAGWPALSPMDCVEAHNGLSDETLPHYHRTSDTFETLHLPFTAKVARTIVAALAGWAGPVD